MRLHSALLVTALLAAAPAEAATYIITYEGTVSNSQDQTGLFNGLGASLDGMAFTAVYTLTAPLAGAVIIDGPVHSMTYGGTYYLAPSPVSGKLTINGVTQAVAGDNTSLASQTNGFGVPGYGWDLVNHAVRDQGTGFDFRLHNYINSRSNDFLSTPDYTSPLTYTVHNGDIGFGSFFFDQSTGSDITRFAFGDLNTTSVTIALAGAVPEPATWAMMIFGFGLIGGAMRRKQRQSVRFNFA